MMFVPSTVAERSKFTRAMGMHMQKDLQFNRTAWVLPLVAGMHTEIQIFTKLITDQRCR